MAQILSTGYQRAAKASQVLVAQTALSFASWEAQLNGDDLPTENFTSYDSATDNAYMEGILGFIGCELRYGGDWDAAANPLDDPPGLYPRDDLASLSFVVNINDATSWAFPYSRVRGATNGAAVKDKVTFSVTGKSQGEFTWPSGSV